MNVSDKGLDLIRHFESLRLEAYLDTGNVPTIGWGHTKGVQMGDTCTREQADAWLFDDCASAEHDVRATVHVPLNQNQFDALVSFVYNIGGKQFANSTLLLLLNRGAYVAAAEQLTRWNKDNGVTLAGLTKRRLMEEDLFLAAE